MILKWPNAYILGHFVRFGLRGSHILAVAAQILSGGSTLAPNVQG